MVVRDSDLIMELIKLRTDLRRGNYHYLKSLEPYLDKAVLEYCTPFDLYFIVRTILNSRAFSEYRGKGYTRMRRAFYNYLKENTK